MNRSDRPSLLLLLRQHPQDLWVVAFILLAEAVPRRLLRLEALVWIVLLRERCHLLLLPIVIEGERRLWSVGAGLQ